MKLEVEALADTLRAQSLTAPGTGSFRAVSERVETAAEAIRGFLAFGGEGWLCHTGSAQVLRIRAGQATSVPEGAWPECGEAHNGAESLRLSPDGAGGWTLVRYVPDAADGFLVEHRFHARDGNDALLYEVCWKQREAADGLPAAYRPVLSRFVGFGDKKED